MLSSKRLESDQREIRVNPNGKPKGKLQLLKRTHVIVVAFIGWNWGAVTRKEDLIQKSLKLNITPSIDASPSRMI